MKRKDRCIVGVDLHPDSFSMAVMHPGPDGELVVDKTVTKSPIGDWRRTMSCLPAGSVIACEASGNTNEFMTQAREFGHEPAILDSREVANFSKRNFKTDKLDAQRIARVYHTGMASNVWLPDEATRDLREIAQRFKQVSKSVTREVNHVKSLLNEHGVRLKRAGNLASADVRKRILGAYSWTEDDLFLLRQHFQQYDTAAECKRATYAYMLKKATRSKPMLTLMRICGIRVITAFATVAAIGTISRFENPKKLCSYFGVVPGIRQSGNSSRDTGMVRDGRVAVKALLVEAAQAILRSKGANAKRLRDFAFRKLMAKKNRNTVIGALARKLAVAIWYALNGMLPEITDNEPAIRKKAASVFSELKLEACSAAGAKSRQEFVSIFTNLVLTP